MTFRKRQVTRKLKDEAIDGTARRIRFGRDNGSMLNHKWKVAVMTVLNKLPDFFREV